ncbi:MAG: lipoate--protein ligase family protein [Fimbriiglobus sp.]
MAADDALLHTAAGGTATLRFYTWAEPTLSLGYFQPAAGRLADSRVAGLPWVRRASGGAALVHHHELTYALALPPGKPWHDPAAPLPWTCRMHHVITAALEPLGAATRPVVCGREQKLGGFLCFLDQTAGDLLADGAKVVGSAQRKHRGAVLQHGGILLKRSEFAPSLPGIFERTGAALAPQDVADAVLAAFAADTGWRPEPGAWTAGEIALRERFAAERYANSAWNEKR